mmetsp:Transcript_39069/g.91021  ORF Transcript_39069/g.91021 Transcript_39069/m.91021 type:complete len:218 (+) Transcript_39069:981-1634(+)
MPVVCSNQVLNEREAKASAPILSRCRCVHLGEGQEDDFLLVSRDANASVDDFDDVTILRSKVSRESDGPFVRKLHGVSDQIGQDLGHSAAVSLHLHDTILYLVDELHTLSHQRLHRSANCGCNFGYAKAFVHDCHLLLPQRRYIQNVIYEPGEARARLLDDLESALHRLGTQRISMEYLGHSDDAIEGSAKLVRDGGKEGLLRELRLMQLLQQLLLL